MKKNLFLSIILISASGIHAQGNFSKIDLYIGGGSQKYRGDLGNGFNFKNSTWRGGFTGSVVYNLNKSFAIGVTGYIGDLGFCQSDAVAGKEVHMEDRCDGCIGRIGLGNISSRMVSGGFLLKYKLNNNYILREDFIVKPYVFAGISANRISDLMEMNCVNTGNYFSINSGLGIMYSINKKISIGYNLTFGYFTSDEIDYMIHHHSNDMYMQNNILIGFHLF